MKILFENSFNQFNTRAIYLKDSISKIDGYESAMRSQNMSFYDSMDEYNPDVYITEANLMNDVSIKYLINNKKLTTVINISDIAEKHVNQLDAIIRDHNINCKFFVSNKFHHSEKHLQTKTPIYRIMEAYDNIFDESNDLNIQGIDFHYPRYVYVDQENAQFMQPNKDCDIFHTLSCIPQAKRNSNIDIFANIMLISKMIKNYDEAIFYIHDTIPQAFYHSIIHNKKTSIYTSDRNKKDVSAIFSKIFGLDSGDGMFYNSYDVNQEDLRKQILDKHNAINRAKRLLSQLN